MKDETLVTLRKTVTDHAWNSCKADIAQIVCSQMRNEIADAIARVKGKWAHNEKAGFWTCDMRLHVMTDDELDALVAKRIAAMSTYELMFARDRSCP